MTVPFTFANQSGTILLAELDANFTAVNAYANTAGTVTANSQPNITSIGILNSLSVTGNVFATNIFTGNITAGNISITGNIHSDFFLGNGRYLTGLYANSNVAAYLPTFSGNLTAGNVSVSGNVYVHGNVAMISNIPRQTYVSNLAPTSSDGNVGDIWYQIS